MWLLQVVLAAGILTHLTVAGPLFGEYNYEDYDYYADYNEDPVPVEETPVAEAEPNIDPEYDYNYNEGSLYNDGNDPVETAVDSGFGDSELQPDYGDNYDYYNEGDDGDAPQTMVLSDKDNDNHHRHHGLSSSDHEGSADFDSLENVVSGATKDFMPVATHGLVPMTKIPKSCMQTPDPGVCRGYFPMFYFDTVTRTCLQFVYGGCRGNANAFKTAKECYEKCHPIGFTRGEREEGGGDSKDDYLRLHDGKREEIFTFVGRDAAMRVDDASLAEFSVRDVYQMEFFFRTDSPHGLIAFLRQTSVPPEVGNKKVQLYVFLRRGHLAVTHIFCCNTETFIMEKGGVQGGNWHSALVKVDSGTGHLHLEVDGVKEIFTIASLQNKPHYGTEVGAAFTSRLWIGGVFEEEVVQEVMVGRSGHFHGCLKKIAFMSGVTSEEMVWHKGIRSSAYRSVKSRCRTNCKSRFTNMCSPNSNCIEHYDHSTCNCYGSGMDGRRCNIPEIPILTLNNDGHVVHRLYEWMDRVHTYTNFISLEFRTRYTDSILFYGSAEYPEKQYLAASLTAAGTVYVEANLGGGAVSAEVGEKLDSGTWHTLTLIHQHNRIQVHLNSRLYTTLKVPGVVRYFHLDPEFYIGSAPNLTKTCGLRQDKGIEEGYDCQKSEVKYYYDIHDASCHLFNYSGCGGNGNNFPDHHTCMNTCNYPGLRSMHSFLGCMKNVYINDVSVLWELKVQNKTTRYHGATELSPFTDTCADRDQMVLMTLSTERAHVNLTNSNSDNFRITISFRPTQPHGVVASGYVDIVDTRSEWEIHYDDKHVSFVIHEDIILVKPNTKIKIGHWQFVDLTYSKGKIIMRVNQKTISNKPPGPLTFFPSIILGLSPRQEYPGMVGCVRRVELSGERIDLRSLVGTDLAQKDVIYDACRVLGPCERPESCEHESKCTLDPDDMIQCDCTGTGYTGKTCHFSQYKTSCEQYLHTGYNTSGVYKIDVDGNGPLPSAYVKCDFNILTGMTTTIVENNLPKNYEVRGTGLGNVQIDIKYRDFNNEMLETFVAKSESCTQKVRYDCRRSPLKLSTHTWFASPAESFITRFGSKVPGLCRCKG